MGWLSAGERAEKSGTFVGWKGGGKESSDGGVMARLAVEAVSSSEMEEKIGGGNRSFVDGRYKGGGGWSDGFEKV